ncbi:MAG: UDP-2,3-diacylglucosamine diphosphatase LpxI [Deltaproteobacteria bacterium]|nr:UDP-2,3-diacylglucosamine diphosphatase LpxI [Deltaproteobacteria bacterium]
MTAEFDGNGAARGGRGPSGRGAGGPAGPGADALARGPVGFIAGNLSLPVLAARKVKEEGRFLAVAGIGGEASEELRGLADRYTELSLGELRPLSGFFLGCGVRDVCMAGGVSRETIIRNYRPDEEAVKLMEGLRSFQTDSILRAVAGWLEARGLNLVSVTDLVPEILVRPGRIGRAEPSPELEEDLSFAFRIARELGRLDVGQTVVACDKIAVALEGADGTDATIRRGASLCSKPVAVAKVLKPSQDTRLDLPVVGPPTVRLLAEVKAGGLALDARGLILLEEEECARLADEAGIALVAWLDPPGAAGRAPRGGGPGGEDRGGPGAGEHGAG